MIHVLQLQAAADNKSSGGSIPPPTSYVLTHYHQDWLECHRYHRAAGRGINVVYYPKRKDHAWRHQDNGYASGKDSGNEVPKLVEH